MHQPLSPWYIAWLFALDFERGMSHGEDIVLSSGASRGDLKEVSGRSEL
jgi:hypothetical protein